MRITLVDDEQIALNVLEILLQSFEFVKIVNKYTDPKEALGQLSKDSPDVVLVDMEMGGLNGIDFAESVLKFENPPEVIFVTAYSEYAVKAFDINALDYLLKPVSEDRLLKALKRAEQNLEQNKRLESEETKKVIVNVLGEVTIALPTEEDIGWRTKKVKELFMYLWQDQQSSKHKDYIIEALWPNTTGTKGIALLHTTVYQLRKTLKKLGFIDGIVLKNEHYKLHIPIQSDYERLLQCMKNKDIHALVERYKGNYMEGEDYPWAESTRYELGQKVIRLLEEGITKKSAPSKTNFDKLRALKIMYQIDSLSENVADLMLNYYRDENLLAIGILFAKAFKDQYNKELSIDLRKEFMWKHKEFFPNY